MYNVITWILVDSFLYMNPSSHQLSCQATPENHLSCYAVRTSILLLFTPTVTMRISLVKFLPLHWFIFKSFRLHLYFISLFSTRFVPQNWGVCCSALTLRSRAMICEWCLINNDMCSYSPTLCCSRSFELRRPQALQSFLRIPLVWIHQIRNLYLMQGSGPLATLHWLDLALISSYPI